MVLPLDLQFKTKGQLAIAILADAAADGVAVDFVCGDEVCGNCTRLEERGQAYVLRVPSNISLTVARGVTLTCARAVRRLHASDRRWEIRSAGTGSKGERWYARALTGTASPRHSLRAPALGRTGRQHLEWNAAGLRSHRQCRPAQGAQVGQDQSGSESGSSIRAGMSRRPCSTRQTSM
jgi:hypothetical protein